MRSGRLFGGLLSDVRRRLAPRVYWSDLRDGFHPQSIASFVFLYVASLAPLITFGGILGDYTGGNMVCRTQRERFLKGVNFQLSSHRNVARIT